MGSPGIIPLEDRLAADTFGASYRAFLELKPVSYRWRHLAPQGVALVGRAIDEKWSDEKLADFLHCDPGEAAACRKRYIMSKKINAPSASADRFRRAVFEWIGEVAELDDSMRKRLAQDLARLMGNQLFVSAQAGEDVMELSRALAEDEGKPSSQEEPSAKPSDGAPLEKRSPWGPQWKD
jgi:hypothetical protein